MRFGFHISVAGGLGQIGKRAGALSCDTIQIFSRNPRGWETSPLDLKEAAELKAELKRLKIYPLVVHMPYLANLATPLKRVYDKSIKSLKIELERAEFLGASFVVIHVGSRMTADISEGIANVIRGVNEALASVGNGVILLLENTAGQGTQIGYGFSQISRIIKKTKPGKRVGVCLDIAHAFQAGYPLHRKDGLRDTLAEFDQTLGLKKLCLLHLNDSKTLCGSKRDRHEHIGKGEIGLAGFRRIIRHPYLSQLPAIMETPRDSDKDEFMNMRTVRRLEKKSGL